MWALIIVGPPLERLLGRVRFLAVYVLSALGGSVLFYLLAPVNEVGAGRFRAPSSACSAPGSWWPGGCRWTSRAIVFLIVINLAISFASPASPGRPTWAG